MPNGRNWWIRLSCKIPETSDTTPFVRKNARGLCHSIAKRSHNMSAAASSSAAASPSTVYGSKRAAMHSLSPQSSTGNGAKRQRTTSSAAEENGGPTALASHAPPFSLRDAKHWAQPQKLAAFQKPAPLCSFSYDAQRALHHDDRQRKYYRAPFDASSNGPLDLNSRYEHFVERANSGVSCCSLRMPFPDLAN
jgi:hypothetical protein